MKKVNDYSFEQQSYQHFQKQEPKMILSNNLEKKIT